MERLPETIKKEIEVTVDIDYCYSIDGTGFHKLVRNILLQYPKLKIECEEGTCYGPCMNIKCRGMIDLDTAEKIVLKLREIGTHAGINYNPKYSTFYLVD